MSELDILGHVGTLWDILGQFGRRFDKFRAFQQFPSTLRPFSPIIGAMREKKRVTDGQTDGLTYRDARTHLKKRVESE